MTTHNTGADAANTAVRAYLTTLGEKYLGHGFNTGSGKGKQIWSEIKESFQMRCAYCDVETSSPTIEHLISFNRSAGGLHHPGNVVPCCRACNHRAKIDGQEVDWKVHLETVVDRDEHSSILTLRERRARIERHVEKYGYPSLSDDEMSAIRTIAESLYESIKGEVRKGTDLYWAIHEAMIGRRGN